MGRVSHTVYLAHGNSKREARDRHKGNSKRLVRNLEERNVGTKERSPKQGITIELPDFTNPT